MLNTKLWGALGLFAILWSGAAMAQDDAQPAAEGDTPAEAPEQMTDDSATEAEKALEEDLDLFWGKRREVEVVQRRLFEKDGGFGLTPVVGVIPNDDFIWYLPVGLRAGYNFSEAFQFQLQFMYALDNDTELTKFLKEADIQEIINFYYNVNILWSPIYGKISFLGLKLTHLETYIGVGFGAFHTRTFDPENPVEQQEIKAGGNTVLGFRWWLTDWFNLQTDYRHYFFPKFQGGVSTPIELSLGLGFLL